MNGLGPRVGLPFLTGRLPGRAAELRAVVGKDGAGLAPPREYLIFQCLCEVLCARGGQGEYLNPPAGEVGDDPDEPLSPVSEWICLHQVHSDRVSGCLGSVWS